MKLWLKYSFGIILGTALFFVVPRNLLDTGGAFALASELAIRIGCYVCVILLSTNIPIAIVKLYEEKKFWPILLRSIFFFTASSLVATVLGLAAAFIFGQWRLPLLTDSASASGSILVQVLFEVFPKNPGALVVNPSEFAFPILIFSLITGLAMAHDPLAAKPTSNLLDSMSRILYTINTFITEILGILLIPITARSLHMVTVTLYSVNYMRFLATCAAAATFVFLVLFPLALFFALGKQNPFPHIFSSFPAALTSLFSGNLRFSVGTIIRQSRENLGIKRRYGGITLPVSLLFGRAGTAFISAMAAVSILSSYSPIAASFTNLVLLVLLIPAATILSGVSATGSIISVLTISSGLFARGFENGYLILVPIAIHLSMMAAFFDAIWIGTTQSICSRQLIPIDRKASAHFI
jgi:Na+/H+-dicarboxylate symporter